MNYTKEDWIIDDANTMVAVMRNGVYEYIADCFPAHFVESSLSIEECEANARLIAAAPDLCNALGSILGYAEEREGEMLEIGGRTAKWYGEAIANARKVLAKAEGK